MSTDRRRGLMSWCCDHVRTSWQCPVCCLYRTSLTAHTDFRWCSLPSWLHSQVRMYVCMR